MSFSSSFDKDPHWQLLKELISQIAQRNSLDVDVDLALGFASHYCKIGTMECLVEEGNAMAFWVADDESCRERGCMYPGCSLCRHCPEHERSSRLLVNVVVALSGFLGDPSATYAVADSIATSEDENVAPALRTFLQEHWSQMAFLNGLRQGLQQYTNLLYILKWGNVSRQEVVCFLRDSGQLVVAARQLSGVTLEEASQGKELLAVLEHHLPSFLLNPSGVV
ncbi:hypothetical protein Leryth_003888 [Lithospermum erythrorhizon]|nr:hypothetical protein Leryth_003888 [Lithospermum erythrorhizon]